MRTLLALKKQAKRPAKAEQTTSHIEVDELFPLECGERTCQASYDVSAFVDIIQLWGFICLGSHQYGHIGFTCPQCLNTTTRKHCHPNSENIVEYLEDVGIDTRMRYRGIRPYLRNYVPFSVREVAEKIEEQSEELGNLISNGEAYTLPDIVQPVVEYPWLNGVSDHFCVDGNEIPLLVELENKYRVKVIPRIVGFSSIYKKTEKFLLNGYNPTEILNDLIETNYGQRQGLAVDREYYEDQYDRLVEDNLTTEEYHAVFRSSRYADPQSIDLPDDVVRDYKELRTTLDFELIYKERFVNRYARRLYVEREPTIQVQTNQEENDGCSAASQSTSSDGTLVESMENLDSAIKTHENVFARKGDTWLIKYRNQATTLRDFEKIRYIAYLLKDPGKEINNCDLVASVKKCDWEPVSVEVDMEESQLDIDLTSEEIQKLREVGWEILSELEEADDTDDEKQKEEAKGKWDLYRKHMINQYGIRVGLSDRQEIVFKSMQRPGPEAEKARMAVRNQIENGFKDIEKELPDLAIHLRQSIHRTSWHAVYKPRPDTPIHWYVFG